MFLRRYMLWMTDASLRRQLPPAYRFFAAYCAAFMSLLSHWRVIGAAPMFALASWLNRCAGRPAHCAVTLPDATIVVNLADPRFVKVVAEVLPGAEETSVLASLLRPGDTFIDVGANHGAFCVAAGRVIGPRGAIVAIEPQPTLAPLVQQTLARSAPCPYVVKAAAAGDRRTTVRLHMFPRNSGECSLHRSQGPAYADDVVEVAMDCLDDMLAWRDLPGHLVVKIDVEGSEQMALRGMRSMCAERRPTLILEINPPIMAAAGVRWDDLRQTLQSLGYSRFADSLAFDRHMLLEDLDPGLRQDIVLGADAGLSTRDLPRQRGSAGLGAG